MPSAISLVSMMPSLSSSMSVVSTTPSESLSSRTLTRATAMLEEVAPSLTVTLMSLTPSIDELDEKPIASIAVS